jgi:DNA-binding IclR family transcriptional regulator
MTLQVAASDDEELTMPSETANRPPKSAAPTSAVDRALDLLTSVATATSPLTLAEAAAETGLAKPTAHRILRVMVARELLRQEADRRYHIGSKLFALAGTVLDRVDFVQEAEPALDWLKQVTPETIHFALVTGDRPVYVQKIEGRRPYRMASSVGMGLTWHSTAIGKAILAFMPAERRAAYIRADRLVRLTATTITTVAALDRELERIRTLGFAIDDSENEDDIRCVGAPVFDARGQVIGALSVSAPAFDLSPDDAIALAPAVKAAAQKISVALGAPADVMAATPGEPPA